MTKRRDGVFKRHGAWWIDYTDADGRRHRKKAAPSYELAKLIYQDTVVAIKKGELTGTREEGMTVAAFVARVWEPETAARLNPDWMVRVRQALTAVILPSFGTVRLARLSQNAIDTWATVRCGQVGASAFNKELWIVKNICKLAEQKSYLVRSPAQHAKRMREPRNRVRLLTDEERAMLIDGRLTTVKATDGRSWPLHVGPSRTLRLYIIAALQTGARRGELLRLQWEDIDFRTGLITVANGKNGDLRSIPLTPTLRSVLLSLPRPLHATAPVLPPRKPLVLTRSFARLCARLDIRNLTFHDLRHDVGSQLAMAGVPIRTIAEILGHRKLEMTLRYAHLAPGHLQEAMTLLAPLPTGTISAPAGRERRVSSGGLDGT